jgi:hypothetical protein
MRVTLLLLCVLALPARAETVEGLYGQGFLQVPWGSSLARTKQTFPRGAMCVLDAGTTYLVYSVLLAQDPLGMGIRDVRASFQFTRDDRLQAVSIHYPYSVRDDVLYRVAELLGQNYESAEEGLTTFHVWNSPRELTAAVKIATHPRVHRATFQVSAHRMIERQR